MNLEQTALILIGFQNDYFSESGLLNSFIEEPGYLNKVIDNTTELIEKIRHTSMPIISTPIQFTKGYSEISQESGILAAIKEIGAFQAGTAGSQTIDEIQTYGARIDEIPGKRGLNAFHGTMLDQYLKEKNIHHVMLAGAVTSICIDSTGREAFEKGYQVTQLADCTAGRTAVEQSFYCDNVFPIYASVKTHDQVIAELLVSGEAVS